MGHCIGARAVVPPRVLEINRLNYKTCKEFQKLSRRNMFYIFVYLARNTLKLTQTDYNSLGTKKSRTEEETKNSCCAPITSFVAPPLPTKVAYPKISQYERSAIHIVAMGSS